MYEQQQSWNHGLTPRAGVSSKVSISVVIRVSITILLPCSGVVGVYNIRA